MPQTLLTIPTHGQGLYEFTEQAAGFVARAGRDEGLLTVFVRHTSASLLIQENADDDVKSDLNAFFRRLVPPSSDPSMRWIIHTDEGPDDMPATYQDGADSGFHRHTGVAGQATTWNLAGYLSFRTSRAAASPGGGAASR